MMTERLRMGTRLVFAISLAAFLPCIASSQQPTDKEPVRCGFLDMYREEGWTIPGLKNSTTKYRGAFKNLPGIFVTELLPSETETKVLQIYCSAKHPGSLEIKDLPIRVLHLTAYEFNGHVFAYGVSYEKEEIENGTRVPLGAASGMIFYDIHGSGRFTICKSAKWPFIPDPPASWAVPRDL
jgi:hypothetical protein